MSPDEPTDVMPGGSDEPTRENRPDEEPTGELPLGNENPTDVIPEGNENPTETIQAGSENPTEAIPPAGEGPTDVMTGPGRGRTGIGVLVAAIVASLVLCGAYVAAGGPVGPDKAADPCDARPWTNPGDLEEAAQQFALSAADGAACELGVSREELTRALANDETRQQFMDEHGLSDADLEDALRAGLNRAVDDAEAAGALSPLAAAGIRVAIKAMPMSVMIGLLENADSIFNGDLGSIGGVGDALDAIIGGADSLGSGDSQDPLNQLGDALQGVLPEGTTDGLDQAIPEDTQKKLEDEAKKQIEQGLNELLGP